MMIGTKTDLRVRREEDAMMWLVVKTYGQVVVDVNCAESRKYVNVKRSFGKRQERGMM